MNAYLFASLSEGWLWLTACESACAKQVFILCKQCCVEAGTPLAPQGCVHHPSPAVSWVICVAQAAVELTEAQQLDLMHLRRLFYCRLGALLRERKALLCKAGSDSTELCWTIGDAVPAAAAEVAEQLRANGIAEYRCHADHRHTLCPMCMKFFASCICMSLKGFIGLLLMYST